MVELQAVDKIGGARNYLRPNLEHNNCCNYVATVKFRKDAHSEYRNIERRIQDG